MSVLIKFRVFRIFPRASLAMLESGAIASSSFCFLSSIKQTVWPLWLPMTTQCAQIALSSSKQKYSIGRSTCSLQLFEVSVFASGSYWCFLMYFDTLCTSSKHAKHMKHSHLMHLHEAATVAHSAHN